MRTVDAPAESSSYFEVRDKEEAKAKVQSLARRRGGVRAFAHGTSTGAWDDITGSNVTIDPSAGGGQFGKGFYTFDALSPHGIWSANWWAEGVATGSGGYAAIAVFEMPTDEYDMLTKLEVPGGGRPPLNAFGVTGYDVVTGPVARAPHLAEQYKFEVGGISRLKFVGAVITKTR